jgi:hypothetical protein
MPDPSVNMPGMTAKDYCKKLQNEKMSAALGNKVDTDFDATICTATTCCQMITEKDPLDENEKVTKCETKIGNTAQCEGSCAATVFAKQCPRGPSTTCVTGRKRSGVQGGSPEPLGPLSGRLLVAHIESSECLLAVLNPRH